MATRGRTPNNDSFPRGRRLRNFSGNKVLSGPKPAFCPFDFPHVGLGKVRSSIPGSFGQVSVQKGGISQGSEPGCQLFFCRSPSLFVAGVHSLRFVAYGLWTRLAHQVSAYIAQFIAHGLICSLPRLTFQMFVFNGI